MLWLCGVEAHALMCTGREREGCNNKVWIKTNEVSVKMNEASVKGHF